MSSKLPTPRPAGPRPPASPAPPPVGYPATLVRAVDRDPAEAARKIVAQDGEIGRLRAEIARLTADHERSRDAAAQSVARWMEAAEVEHGHRLAAEAERDALWSACVVPAIGPWAGAWFVPVFAVRDPTLPQFYPTREAAVAAVRRAAGLDGEG